MKLTCKRCGNTVEKQPTAVRVDCGCGAVSFVAKAAATKLPNPGLGHGACDGMSGVSSYQEDAPMPEAREQGGGNGMICDNCGMEITVRKGLGYCGCNGKPLIVGTADGRADTVRKPSGPERAADYLRSPGAETTAEYPPETEIESPLSERIMRCRLCGMDVAEADRAQHLKQHYGQTAAVAKNVETDFAPIPPPPLSPSVSLPWHREALRPRPAEDAKYESDIATKSLKNRVHGRDGYGSFIDVGDALVDSLIVELLNRGHGRAEAIEIVASHLPRKLADLVEADWRDDRIREANRMQREASGG